MVAGRIDAVLPRIERAGFEIVREDCIDCGLDYVSEGMIRGQGAILLDATAERGHRQREIPHERQSGRQLVFERHGDSILSPISLDTLRLSRG